jgi:hypothetical protein
MLTGFAKVVHVTMLTVRNEVQMSRRRGSVEERAGLISAMTSFSLANNDQLLAITLCAHVLATLQLAVAAHAALCTILMRLH